MYNLFTMTMAKERPNRRKKKLYPSTGVDVHFLILRV